MQFMYSQYKSTEMEKKETKNYAVKIKIHKMNEVNS